MSAHNRTHYIAHQNISAQHPMNRVDVRTMEASSRTDAIKEAGEEVVTIHKKLQQETENILRWKASSEVNTKQLELQLEEAKGNVSDLRRNLMELQLTNENLSQSLIREREERALTNTKVIHTRELISSLQQQFQELESTVNVFHQEKQYHCAVQEDTIERLNILSGNFKELSLLSEEKLKVITEKAKEDTSCLQNKVSDLEHSIETKISECNLHLKVIEDHEKEISDLTCRLKLANTLASETEEKCVQLNNNLNEVQDTLAEKLVDLQNQESENLQIKKELKEEQLKLKQSKSEFQEAVEKIKFLKNANNVLEGAQSEITEKLEAVTSLKFEIEKDVEQKYQVIENLEAEKGTLLSEIDELKQSLESLTIQLHTKDENCRTLVREKEELLQQIESINAQLVNEQERVKEFQEKLSSMAENLQSIENLVEELKKSEENHVQFSNKLQEELQEKELTVKGKNDEIESLVQKIKEFQETEIKLNENLSSFWDEIMALRTSMEQQLKIFEEEKKTMTENFAVAEGSLKDTVEELRTQIEREREKFENDKNSWENILSEKDTSAEQIQEELLSKISNLETELKEARDNLQDQAEFTRKEMDDLSCKTLSEKSLLEEEKQSLDEKYQKINKSYATLQNKHENLAAELKSLKSRFKEEQDDLKAKNKKILQNNKKLEKLEKTVTDLKANANTLQNTNKEFELECMDLKKKIEHYEEMQSKSKDSFNAEVRALEEELQKEKCNRENLEEELKTKKQEFEYFHNNTSEKMQKMNEDMQKLLSCHQVQIDTLEQEKEKLEKEKQEIEQQTSLKVNHVEAETDKKIKQMADLLARYKAEYEEKLAEAELQMSRLQVAHEERQSKEDVLKNEKHISVKDSPRRSSLNKSHDSSLLPSSDNEGKAANHQGRTKMSKISTAHTEVVDETFSPYQYAKESFVFKEPPLPKDSNYCSSQNRPDEGLGHKDSSSSILKNKRTLLPAATQKHVMFKLPQSCLNSGDSSSDACTFEIVDSDDVFEEVRISGRRSNFSRHRSHVKPLANVLPMRISNASDGENDSPKIVEDHMSLSQESRGPPSNSKSGKFFRDKKRKKEFKTYSMKKFPGSGRNSYP